MKKFLLISLLFLSFGANATGALGSKLGNNNDEPIKITSDKLDVMEKEKIAIFSGKVEAIQGDTKIQSDKMTVHYNEKPGQQRSISKIDVAGNVVLLSPRESAKSASGTYDVEKNVVTLNGAVTLTKGPNVLKGNQLVYNMETGKSQISGGNNTKEGRVQGLFVPEKKK